MIAFGWEQVSGMSLRDVTATGPAAARVTRLQKACKCLWCHGRKTRDGGECGKPPKQGRRGISGDCHYEFWITKIQQPIASRESWDKARILEGRILAPKAGRPKGSKTKVKVKA